MVRESLLHGFQASNLKYIYFLVPSFEVVATKSLRFHNLFFHLLVILSIILSPDEYIKIVFMWNDIRNHMGVEDP